VEVAGPEALIRHSDASPLLAWIRQSGRCSSLA
jgi:hypothetical protein